MNSIIMTSLNHAGQIIGAAATMFVFYMPQTRLNAIVGGIVSTILAILLIKFQ